jgi:pimeloyl-ACP methyl ester carboxylesterase
MAPVARRLSSRQGVLEPLHAADTLDGQVTELVSAIERAGDPPAVVVGFSWGALLGWVLAARRPRLVSKLVLVGCPPFEERFASYTKRNRLDRLDAVATWELEALMVELDKPGMEGKDEALSRLGTLMSSVDAYDPLPEAQEASECSWSAHMGPWEDAARLRRDGSLLTMGRSIDCPVVAIHGDHDPHPAEAVEDPLSALLQDFRFILLERCGHKPWVERWAKEAFYLVLERELLETV